MALVDAKFSVVAADYRYRISGDVPAVIDFADSIAVEIAM